MDQYSQFHVNRAHQPDGRKYGYRWNYLKCKKNLPKDIWDLLPLLLGVTCFVATFLSKEEVYKCYVQNYTCPLNTWHLYRFLRYLNNRLGHNDISPLVSKLLNRLSFRSLKCHLKVNEQLVPQTEVQYEP